MAPAERAVKLSALQRFRRYVVHRLGLESYLVQPGDGRRRPQISARDLLWSLLAGALLRECSSRAIEALVRSPARAALGVRRGFGDDALAYFTQRLDPAPTRRALARALRQAKRNKAFEGSRWIGLSVDGSGAGRSVAAHCGLCHPRHNAQGELRDHLHHLTAVSVVGTGLSLPCDLEPFGPADSEQRAGERALKRVVEALGRRFADYVVVDAGFANAAFMDQAGALGLRVVARLKDNLPSLYQAAQARFAAQAPTILFESGRDRVEVWDADDFDPWEKLRWLTVRVVRYRQHHPDNSMHEAYWLTDWPIAQVGPRALFAMAKSRWEIENQGFNDAKNRYGLEHVRHHHANSLEIEWLLVSLVLTLERLYRQRYLHRGTHPRRAAIDLVRAFRLSLAAPLVHDTS